LTKPHDEGGLELSRIASSLVIAAVMVVFIILTYKRPGRTPNAPSRRMQSA